MDLTVSIKVIELALDYSNSMGIYTLQEAYCAFICVNQLKKLIETKTIETKTDEVTN